MTPRNHKDSLNPMMRMLKRAARAPREHGIALLFTLCILSMALITAMIFSSSASTGRKIAGAYVDSSAARILADGAVSRATLALMECRNASYVCSSYRTNNLRNKDAGEYASDWIWKLEKKGLYSFNKGPIRFTEGDASYYDFEDSRCPSWEYVSSRGYGESTDHIIGRYAYVAIGMNDQLNPNAIGNRGKDDDSDFNEDTFRKRLGRWTCEPEFVFRSDENGWDYSTILSPELIQEKYVSPDGWDDLDVFISAMTGDAGSAASKQIRMMADQYFDVSQQGEYNRFRNDGNPVGELTKFEAGDNEEWRFPLLRTDWDTISLETVKGAIPWFRNADTGAANVNQTVANLINYNAHETRAPVTDNENWITGTPSYTGNKRTPYINEVHADVSVGGNLGMRLAERRLAADQKTWEYFIFYTDCTYDHKIVLDVETVNMYNNPLTLADHPILIGEISYKFWNPNGDGAGFWESKTVRFDASTPWEVSKAGDAGKYFVYTLSFDQGGVGSVTTPKRGPYSSRMCSPSDFYEYLKVSDIKVSIDRVVLQDSNGRNADLALMPFDLLNGHTFTGEAVVGGLDDGKHVYCDSQVNDPRFNLGREQWSSPAFAEEDNKLSPAATLYGRNNSINFGNVHDNERQNDPVYNGNDSISTAYIPHKPMISMWELGAIHRGAPWQTINLKCAPSQGTGMGSYQAGDGHLLDHVALATSTEDEDDAVIGFINLNCVSGFGSGNAPFTFKSLFTNFPIYDTYANMDAGTRVSELKDDDLAVDSDHEGNSPDVYAKELANGVTTAVANGNYKRRTAVFPTQFPSNYMGHIIPSGSNITDAQSEEIFCRVVNLLKWNQQQVKRAAVLVLAQTIKDAGGTTLEKNLPTTNTELWFDAGFANYENTDAKLKTSPPDRGDDSAGWKVKTIRDRYAERAVAYRQYDNFYDQITGEAKIIVRLEWDQSANEGKGAWKVTRKEYAE